MERVAQGDPSATQLCIDTYGGLVWSIALRFSPTRSDAEDAVQEVFLDLWKNADRFDARIASEKTFIAMIARRRLIDQLRKSSRQPSTESLTVGADDNENGQRDVSDDDNSYSTVERSEEVEKIEGYIKTLKPEAQQVLKLAIHEGWSQSQIAERLNMPLGTVKTTVRRSLIKVREMMGLVGADGATPEAAGR